MWCRIITKYYLFLFFTVSYSQNSNYYKDIDSLSKKNYEELTDIIFDENNDSSLVANSVETYINKAYINNDSLKIVEGLYFKTITTNSKENNVDLYDSIIKLSSHFKNKNYPTIAYFDKGTTYYNRRKFKIALDNYLLALKYNRGNNKEYLDFLISRSIAILKNRIDYDDEALQLYKRCLEYAKKKSFKTSNQRVYFSLLASIAHTHRKIKNLDSALYYNSIALDAASKTNFQHDYHHLLLNDGVINYHKKDYKKSYNNIVKGLEYIKTVDDKPNMAVGYYYLGKLYLEFNEIDKAIKSFKKVDTIFQLNKDILPETRESYKLLANYYKKKKDLKNELLYIERLIEVDSVLADNYKFLTKEINYDYDRPKLIIEKEDLITKISAEKNQYTIISLLILIAFIIFIGFYFYKQKLNKQKLEALLNKTIKKKATRIKTEIPEGISENIVKDLINKLNNFEKNKEYLDSNISVTILANKFDTNSTYISKIINHYKSKNFTTYINDLRIDYVTEELKTNTIYRKFTIRALAREVGFNSSESFSKAFVKKNGIKPSFYIISINKNLIFN